MEEKTAVAPREATHRVLVGSVPVGGGAPIAVQSMLNVPTTDVRAALAQIEALKACGCEIARLAVPRTDCLAPFSEICAASPLPLVADIHFDYRLAIGAAEAGAAKLRINPGNIGSWERTDAVIDAAGAAGIPIRIGVNGGSLEAQYREKTDWHPADRLIASVVDYVEHFESRGFDDIVVSAKAHSVTDTVEVYRRLSREIPQAPLHLGVTEAGTLRQGTVKSAAGIGILLAEGIGDTFRVSLTADVTEEVHVAWDLLSALGLRRLRPEIVSCPTCGRTEVDLVGLATKVEEALLTVHAPLSVAVMGCVVNGPGEAADADIGVACGKGVGVIFKDGRILRKVPESDIVAALLEEIRALL